MGDKDTPDSRLAAAVSVWVKNEIERGFKIAASRTAWVEFESQGQRIRSAHVAFCCGGEKRQGAEALNWQPSIEQAARHLVRHVRTMMIDHGLRPETHRLVWRDLPLIDQDGAVAKYVSEWNAYCRLSFVPIDAELLPEDV